MFNNINTRSVTFNLIFINFLVFAIINIPALKLPAIEYGALFYPASPLFKPVQVVTHMFMHATWWHVISNMLALFFFGFTLERVWGHQRFLLYYLITAFGAVLLYTGVHVIEVYRALGTLTPTHEQIVSDPRVLDIYRTPTVGASGAVFGILAAYALLFGEREIHLYGLIPVKAKILIGGYIIMELLRGIEMHPGDNVAHFMHLGGALFGYILIKIWGRNRDFLY